VSPLRRQRARLSPSLREQIIGVFAELMAVAPTGEQNDPPRTAFPVGSGSVVMLPSLCWSDWWETPTV
jgi:hypothetical protein